MGDLSATGCGGGCGCSGGNSCCWIIILLLLCSFCGGNDCGGGFFGGDGCGLVEEIAAVATIPETDVAVAANS